MKPAVWVEAFAHIRRANHSRIIAKASFCVTVCVLNPILFIPRSFDVPFLLLLRFRQFFEESHPSTVHSVVLEVIKLFLAVLVSDLVLAPPRTLVKSVVIDVSTNA